MNRDIKFRALTFDDKWIYTDKDWMFNFTGEFAWNPGHGDGPTLIRLQPGSIQQYTGLKDKNRVEIYEGDVCFRSRPNGMASGQFVVRWRAKEARFNQLSSVDGVRIGSIEVIGNVYASPEQLK